MTRRFECVENGAAKFWEIAVDGSVVTLRFGKLGTPGQQKTKNLGSDAAAAREANKLVREKVGKGYVEVMAAVENGPAALAPRGEPDLRAVVSTRELELFRGLSGKRAFFGDTDYGEVTFLSPTATPRMRAHQPEAPMWDRADWVAEEADDAVIGYLKIDGIPTDERPVVILDNEGCLHLTGACLVDHFGSYPSAADDEDALEPLRKLCEKHGLPRWRTRETVRSIARELGLSDLSVERAPALDREAWRAALARTQPGAATRAPKPKAASAIKGKGVRPLASGLAPKGGVTRDGHPFFFVPDAKAMVSRLYVWTGDGFDLREAVPGYWTNYEYDESVAFAWSYDKALVKRGTEWAPMDLPEAFNTMSSHPRGGLYGLTQTGDLYRWSGSDFVKIAGVAPRPYSRLARDESGGLYVVGGRSPDYSRAVDETLHVTGDTVRKLARYTDRDGVRGVLCVGRKLVVLGSRLHVLDLDTRRWTSSALLNLPDWLVPLDTQRVAVLRAMDLAVHAFDLETLEPKVVGTLLLKPTMNAGVVGDGRGTLIVAGPLGTDRNYKVAAEPQIWSKNGEARATPGCEKEMRAHVAAQAKNLAVHQRWHGPIVQPEQA